MTIIGLTGGIASGKTTVANLFKEHGIIIIDADKIAHELVEPGKKAHNEIIKHFGEEILHDDETLNRAMLREKIFANTQEKLWIESLLHPMIREQIKIDVVNNPSPYHVIVIPLLIENYPYPDIDRVLVVDVDEEQQVIRAMQRDNITEQLAKEIIAQQATRTQRLKYADDVILNDEDLEKLSHEVAALHEKYLKLTQ